MLEFTADAPEASQRKQKQAQAKQQCSHDSFCLSLTRNKTQYCVQTTGSGPHRQRCRRGIPCQHPVQGPETVAEHWRAKKTRHDAADNQRRPCSLLKNTESSFGSAASPAIKLQQAANADNGGNVQSTGDHTTRITIRRGQTFRGGRYRDGEHSPLEPTLLWQGQGRHPATTRVEDRARRSDSERIFGENRWIRLRAFLCLALLFHHDFPAGDANGRWCFD